MKLCGKRREIYTGPSDPKTLKSKSASRDQVLIIAWILMLQCNSFCPEEVVCKIYVQKELEINY